MISFLLIIWLSSTLEIQVSPTISMAPSTILVRVRVEHHANNRGLRVEADSENYFRSTEIELDGENAPLMNEFRFKDLPAGDYIITAVLRTTERFLSVKRGAVVIEREDVSRPRHP